MWMVLGEWLVKVHNAFDFIPETLHKTFGIIFKYLEKNQINKEKFQLLGVSSLILAVKFHENKRPKLPTFVKICDNCYPAQ